MRHFILIKISVVLFFSCTMPAYAFHRRTNDIIGVFNRTGLPQSNTSAGKLLSVRISPVVDLYYLLRTQASSKDTILKGSQDFAVAVRAARQLQDAFGDANSPAWGFLDIALNDCQNASDAVQAFARLPVSLRGGAIPMREGATRLAEAMSAVEPLFLKTIWPKHKSLLNARLAEINRQLISRDEEYFAYVAKNLKIDISLPHMNFYLVAESPEPGSITYFLRDGSRISVVSAQNRGALLFVAMLYETGHVLRHLMTGKTVFGDLNEQLSKLHAPDADVQNLVLALLFVQGIETVQRLTRPARKSDRNFPSVDARFPYLSTVVRPAWSRYLDGKIQYAEALDQIVAEYAKARKLSSPGQ